ncbi:MAG: hypothetical protein QXX95_07920 [Nitrososphaerales archaeon]
MVGIGERKEEKIWEVLHIATFGEESKDLILVGIKYLPISKLILITTEEERTKASGFFGEITKP